MLPKPIEAITAGDLEGLVSARESEGRNLEFKQELPGGKDDDVREFLNDISSFANAYGFDVIYGIRDEDSKAVELLGVPSAGAEGVQLRLENILRDCLDSRIAGVKFHWVTLPEDKSALII